MWRLGHRAKDLGLFPVQRVLPWPLGSHMPLVMLWENGFLGSAGQDETAGGTGGEKGPWGEGCKPSSSRTLPSCSPAQEAALQAQRTLLRFQTQPCQPAWL